MCSQKSQKNFDVITQYVEQAIIFFRLESVNNNIIHIIPMTFYFILLVFILADSVSPQAAPLSNSQLAIKTGIVKVTLNSNDAATVSITYPKTMPDPVYNSVATLAYISNYAPSVGLNFSANCNNGSDQVKLQCAVVAQSSSNSNIVYLTFVASDLPDFIVGDFLSALNITNASLSTSISTTLALPADSPFKQARNAINFIPFISGVSSLDQSFGFSFGFDQSFDTTTSILQFTITVNEFQQKTLNLTFGYILFLADRHVLNIFPEKRYQPNNSNNNKNIIYAIQTISFVTPTPQAMAEASPLIPVQALSAQTSPPTLIDRQNYSAPEPAQSSTIQPAKIAKRSLQTAQLTSSKKSKFHVILQQYLSLITDGNFSLSQVQVRTVTQEVIQNEAAPTNQTNIFISVATKPKTYKVMDATGLDNPSFSITAATSTSEFQQLFATNGFTIIVNTTISDPVLYLELDPYVNVVPQGVSKVFYQKGFIISAETNLPTLYIAEPINTNLPRSIGCQGGFMITDVTKISIIQKTYRYVCKVCTWWQYFDWSKKLCIDFPIISSFLNVVDPI